jgi:hypothetical protein
MLVVFNAMSKRTGTMLDSDVLFGFRLQLFDIARERGVSEACRIFGVHRSTYYRWKGMVERSGLEMLRPRERRAPRMPNQLSPVIETRILAFAIAHPGLGPRPYQRQSRPGALGWHPGQSQRCLAGAASTWSVSAHQPPVTGGGLCRAARS